LTWLSSLVVLSTIPEIDFAARKKKFDSSSRSNFIEVGIGMILATVSILLSDWASNGTSLQFVILSWLQYIFYSWSEVLFYCAGYDLAYIESNVHLRGTTTGLFMGLGAFFGGIIYYSWYFIPPKGFGPTTWYIAKLMVSIILVYTLFVYIPLVHFYYKAKKREVNLNQN
jgi:hypothetical protein